MHYSDIATVLLVTPSFLHKNGIKIVAKNNIEVLFYFIFLFIYFFFFQFLNFKSNFFLRLYLI